MHDFTTNSTNLPFIISLSDTERKYKTTLVSIRLTVVARLDRFQNLMARAAFLSVHIRVIAKVIAAAQNGWSRKREWPPEEARYALLPAKYFRRDAEPFYHVGPVYVIDRTRIAPWLRSANFEWRMTAWTTTKLRPRSMDSDGIKFNTQSRNQVNVGIKVCNYQIRPLSHYLVRDDVSFSINNDEQKKI